MSALPPKKLALWIGMIVIGGLALHQAFLSPVRRRGEGRPERERGEQNSVDADRMIDEGRPADDSSEFNWGPISEKEKNQEAVRDWLVVSLLYDGPDRNEALDAMMAALRSRGVGALPEIRQAEKALSPVMMQGRQALIEALSEIGRDLTVSLKKTPDQPEALKGKQEIDDQLESIVYREPAALNEKERKLADTHLGIGYTERDGKIYQDFSLAKVSAMQALADFRDENATKILKTMSQNTALDPNLRDLAAGYLTTLKNQAQNTLD